MKYYVTHKLLFPGCVLLLVLCLLFPVFLNTSSPFLQTEQPQQVNRDGIITWVDFTIPCEALERAMQYDIDSKKTDHPIDWIGVLAYLGAKYGGNFSRYRASDMDKLCTRLKEGESLDQLTSDFSSAYGYYYEAYSAVLGEFLGTFAIRTEDENGNIVWKEQYGLKVFSPIAEGFYFDHYDDFCADRSYGYQRKHFGHDLMASLGTPVVAVESGVVEELGWNQYGGWRIGIRSFDQKRYYYYAHLRRDRPYHPNVQLGAVIKAGDVIGYVGRTGYSTKENTDNITATHLHWGIQLIFDESQKDASTQIWIDLYEITKFLQRHRASVFQEKESREYYRKYEYWDPDLALRLPGSSPPEREQTDSFSPAVSDELGVAVPVIMYHSLLKDPAYSGKYVIPPSLFAQDLDWLKKNGYQTVLVSDLIRYVDLGTPLPERPVLITFDDGYYNNYLYAFPLLLEKNMKAVISVIGTHTDHFSEMDDNNAYYSHCTWDQLNEMLRSGLIEVQNHSYNLHTYDNNRHGCANKKGESLVAYRNLLCEDLTKLQSRITQMTGTTPTAFTYPFGSHTAQTRQLVYELGFRATFSCEEGISVVEQGNPDSLYLLKRFLRPAGSSSAQFFAGIFSKSN